MEEVPEEIAEADLDEGANLAQAQEVSEVENAAEEEEQEESEEEEANLAQASEVYDEESIQYGSD